MLSAFVAHVQAEFADLVGARLLVALSGGGDSTALLHLVAGARAALKCSAVAAHVHHHARGAEADADAAFCAALAARLEVPFIRLDIDRPAPRGESREAFWRRARYDLLDSARRDANCTAVATAHTMDDQAETVLLKLLRGAGPRGVAGIRVRHGRVVRPLLAFRREALREWLVGRGETWREDASNRDAAAPRSVVRNDVVPVIVARWPGAVEHLAAFAAALAGDETLLTSWSGPAFRFPSPTAPMPLADVMALPLPARRRWTLALASRLPLAEAPSRAQLEAIESMLATGRPGGVDLGRRWVLRRRGERVCLSPPPLPRFEAIAVTVPSETPLPGGFTGFLGGGAGRGDRRARLDPRLAGSMVTWRSVRAGERLPTAGNERIAKRLAAVGVPAEWRAAWPVLEADGRIVWVPGLPVPPSWAGDESSGVLAELEEPWNDRSRS